MKSRPCEVVRSLHPSVLLFAQCEQWIDLHEFTRASFDWLEIPGDVPLLARIRALWAPLITALRVCPTVSLTRLSSVLSNDEKLAALILGADARTRSVLIAHFRGEVGLLERVRRHVSPRTIEISLTCGPPYAGPHARRVLALALERRLFGSPR